MYEFYIKNLFHFVCFTTAFRARIDYYYVNLRNGYSNNNYSGYFNASLFTNPVNNHRTSSISGYI